VLSAGCAGSWYFEWFEERFGPVRRHIGFEPLAPEPDELPPEVEWIPRTIGSLQPVEDGEVGLVFAGQVIEHVQPNDLIGFLCEAHRVLEPGGQLVLDSPNSRVTRALGWEHPEHVVELAVDEIATIAELAGFGRLSVFGVWLCYDRERHAFLALDPRSDSSMVSEDRARLAQERPEDSFIWWLEGRREDRPPRRSELTDAVARAMVRDRMLRAIRRANP